jgi:hypothetical protein
MMFNSVAILNNERFLEKCESVQQQQQEQQQQQQQQQRQRSAADLSVPRR